MIQQKRNKHIGIAGNIGSGKTTLTKLLAEHYEWTASYERVDDNPYLNDFYKDMKRWAFNLQVFFLNSRFRQVLEIHSSDRPIIQDRTIYEDAFIFAPNLHEMGLMEARDYRNYKNLFNIMTSLIEPPDLLIYLKSSVPTLIEQIKRRGREYEASISQDYLSNLNQRYDDWINNYNLGNVLVIEADGLDFLKNDKDFCDVVEKIDNVLNHKS